MEKMTKEEVGEVPFLPDEAIDRCVELANNIVEAQNLDAYVEIEVTDWDLIVCGLRALASLAIAIREEDKTFCAGCKQEIDPTVCGCGMTIDGSNHEGHNPIPMGCICYRDKGNQG